MFRVKIKGVEVCCDDERDVLRLVKLAVAPDDTETRPVGRPPINGETYRKTREKQGIAQGVAFLELLFRVGTTGATSEQVADAMKLKGERGIGGALVRLKRILGQQGFTQWSEVFKASGVPGSRRWKSGSRISEAIAKLGPDNGAG